MAKKSLSDDSQSRALPYEMEQFDEKLSGKELLAKEDIPSEEPEIKEEDIQARIEALEHEGYEKGYVSGYQKGISDGERETLNVLKRLEEVIKSLENFRDKEINELLPGIIELSLEIAKKVIHKEVELDKNLIMSVAQDALSKVGEKERDITIKVNPLDYEVMLSGIELLKGHSGIKNISIEPLATISPGGCYIETQTGEIDAKIEEQIKEVQDAVRTAADREM